MHRHDGCLVWIHAGEERCARLHRTLAVVTAQIEGSLVPLERCRKERCVELLQVGPTGPFHFIPWLHELTCCACPTELILHVVLAEQQMWQARLRRMCDVAEEAGVIANEFYGVIRPAWPVVCRCPCTMSDQHVHLSQSRVSWKRRHAPRGIVRIAIGQRRDRFSDRGDRSGDHEHARSVGCLRLASNRVARAGTARTCSWRISGHPRDLATFQVEGSAPLRGADLSPCK